MKIKLFATAFLFLVFFLLSSFSQHKKTDLTEFEKQSLIFMIEEEKLAHDVYVTLNEKWNYACFTNISKSENFHKSQIKNLLDTFNIEFEIIDSIGEFNNHELKALYNSLIEKGKLSLQDAFEVGATIEDKDIYDLQEALLKIENQQITDVYNNLIFGSKNHIKAFTRNLNSLNYNYVPQFISVEQYNTIISTKNKKVTVNTSCQKKCKN